MICHNCKTIFDRFDAVKVREDYGEFHYACPACGADDMSETDSCRVCHDEFDAEDLHNGFCMDCLWFAIDYDVALKYMLYEQDGLGLVNFFLDEWFNADCINKTTKELTAFFEALYGKLASAERDRAKLFPGIATPFIEALRNHIMPDYPNRFDSYARDFSEWYAEEIEKKEAAQPQHRDRKDHGTAGGEVRGRP